MEKETLILSKLDLIKAEIDFIKNNFLDITLTEDDINSLDEAEKEFKQRKTISHEQLKKEMGCFKYLLKH